MVLDELPGTLSQQQSDRVLHVTAVQQRSRDVEEVPVRLPGAVVEPVPQEPFGHRVREGRALGQLPGPGQGRTQQLWRVDFIDESGRLIAHGELRLQNVAGKS